MNEPIKIDFQRKPRLTLKSPNTAAVRGRPSTENQIVLDAAIRCFETEGAHRTSMADIATEAGISRHTVYRLFEDRATLIEHVLITRFAIIGKRIAKHILAIADPREAMIEGVLFSANAAREDRLFNQIIRKDTNYRIEQLIVRGNEKMLRDSYEFWGPIVARGREAGLIKHGLTNERIFELMMSINAVLIMRADSDKQVQRRFLIDLLDGVLN